MKRYQGYLLAFASLLVLGCAESPFQPYSNSGDCSFDSVRFEADFQTARLSACRQVGNEYQLLIEPESNPAHHSPWYAFSVQSDHQQKIVIKLVYADKKHRYSPKISNDKHHWTQLDNSSISVKNDGQTVRMVLEVGSKPLYVAAQEIFDNDNYEQWESILANKPYVNRSVIGLTEQGRPVTKLETQTSDSNDYLVLVGRQHPPEVTGALAMFHFVNTILSDSDLAVQFRKHINLLIVPNMNPDGVALGYWRKNTNGVDLNRDWGPFEQAETRLIRDELNRFQGDENIRFFLDFHSTSEDIFYTMSEGLPGNPSVQIDSWLNAIARRMPDYTVRRRASYKPDSYISKNYIYKTFEAPAVTYEMGDNTSRVLIARQATVAAEEMMKLLLKQPQ
ncbi:M14 family metallopeptidase [Porticoccaceae bacterium LTM1]|nr:M14 family metallopeptidase [Porticoccaceae bacterium LTM1]